MNRASDELLACSTFAEDQDRVVVLADLLNKPVYALHLRGNTDQTAEAGPGAKLLAQNPIFLIHFQQTDDAVELGPEFRNMKRLRNIVGGSNPRGFHGALDRAVLGEHDHRGLRIRLANSFEEFQSSQLGNAQIGDHHVDAGLLQDFRGLLGGRGGPGAPTRFGHHVPAQVP